MGVTICALFCPYIGDNFNMDKKKFLIFITLVHYILAQDCEPDDTYVFPDGCDCEYNDVSDEFVGKDCPASLKQEESAEPCRSYFRDSEFIKKLQKDYDIGNRTIEKDLVYECTKNSLCRDDRNATGFFGFSVSGPDVTSLIENARNAKCPDDLICCNTNYVDK